MNAGYDSGFAHAIRDAWRRKSDYTCSVIGAELFTAPFRCAVLPNVFDASLLLSVKQSVLGSRMNHKSNDLYEFYQSDDLTRSTNKAITALKDTLTSDVFLKLMTDMTGIALIPNRIDLSAHIYRKGGHLLCHDDDIAESDTISRRIAFIIYLVEEDWSVSDGGQLQLFDKDAANYPGDITRAIVPRFNSLAFFEVFPCSYHQVQEVFTRDRVSISGWLYGPRIESEAMQDQHPVLPMQLPVSIDRSSGHALDLTQWISPTYLNAATITRINSTFCDESCIELQDFLLPAQFNRIQHALESEQPNPLGPVNIKHYTLIKPNSGILHELMRMLTSSDFKAWLVRVSGMSLQSSYANQLRSFRSGDYTLMQDLCVDPIGLDVNLCLSGGKEWNTRMGGQIVYVSESETLITIEPRSNALNLVCRDDATHRFVKYISADQVEAKFDVDLVWLE